MPIRKNADQPSAERDPMNVFVEALRLFKKEPSTWAENGLLEALQGVIGSNTDSSEFDSEKILAIAVRVFKSTKSFAAADMVMEAARLYKSHYIAALSKKFDIRSAQQSGLFDD